MRERVVVWPGWAGNPGGEHERARAGQDKGPPSPHLAAKGAGQHLHDKAKPCQFGLAPRGDCPPPLKWAAGQPAGRGLQGPRHFPPLLPRVRSSAGTGPRGQDTGTAGPPGARHRSGGTRTHGTQHPEHPHAPCAWHPARLACARSVRHRPCTLTDPMQQGTCTQSLAHPALNALLHLLTGHARPVKTCTATLTAHTHSHSLAHTPLHAPTARPSPTGAWTSAPAVQGGAGLLQKAPLGCLQPEHPTTPQVSSSACPLQQQQARAGMVVRRLAGTFQPYARQKPSTNPGCWR